MVTFQWPVCNRSYSYETVEGPPLSSLDTSLYKFEGNHSVIPCTPISFDSTTYTHIDLKVSSSKQFKSYTFCVSIQLTVNRSGIILHYRSEDQSQHIVVYVDSGKAALKVLDGHVEHTLMMDLDDIVINHWYFICVAMKDSATK